MPPVRIRVEDTLRHVHQEVVVAELEETFDIASIETLVGPAHGLDVLLRHRYARCAATSPASPRFSTIQKSSYFLTTSSTPGSISMAVCPGATANRSARERTSCHSRPDSCMRTP